MNLKQTRENQTKIKDLISTFGLEIRYLGRDSMEGFIEPFIGGAGNFFCVPRMWS
ncbi:unnamed protein product [Meloidogyne enterolobii]|uniref:Uncharacterized protein n=1 Tax=Meloidogyne enterolobii TaxID=390850 RepID=A0ACB1AC83_MELEN